ncbi:hypothetical protein [Bradyrhizobium uaiense]|uniref:Type II restriction endonuclease subunit M n=1 Tax=Bradyrhizobium uaiense TaxID=2594946 RepID=A0A6P1BFA0_9BRAD|nr:hypothetical protein [Bradyrhizobium uaiense]NEU96933.1 hypothetical protein [Bradyrhizobium uaiense]
MTVFVRLLDVPVDQKPNELLANVAPFGGRSVEMDPLEFASIPNSPFVYWASANIRRLFTALPPFQSEGRTARQGLATADDFRFVRAWWECPIDKLGSKWFPFAKGGSYSPYFSNLFLVVNWDQSGKELTTFVNPETGKHYSRPQSVDRYFQPGLTWPSRPYRRGSFSLVSPGAIFSHTGTMAFSASEDELPALACVLNSDAFIGLLHLLLPRGGEGSDRTLQYEVGYVTSVPVPTISVDTSAKLSLLFRRAWSLRRSYFEIDETSRAFVLPLQLRRRLGTYNIDAIFSELEQLDAEINRIVFDLYGVDAADRSSLAAWSRAAPTNEDSDPADPAPTADSEVNDDNEGVGVSSDDSTTMLSWAVGVAFGRFDVRFATGEATLPTQPDSLDPPSAKSTGMRAVSTSDNPIVGYLVDDDGHQHDIVDRVCSVYDAVGGYDYDSTSVRSAIAHDLFPMHLKMYGKSRRKAPIYWQIATPSLGYSIWLYAHALTGDTLMQLQTDLLEPKLSLERRNLDNLKTEHAGEGTGRSRREVEEQERKVDEIQALLDEVKRLSPLWRPNLDDGIIVNFAPFWRLVPHNRAWQKELRAVWDALCAGELDWTQLAMHLWPERVVPKCAINHNLAVAHGIEDVFWFEDRDGKCKLREKPRQSAEQLVRARSSASVQTALKSFMAAPTSTTTRGARRARTAR